MKKLLLILAFVALALHPSHASAQAKPGLNLEISPLPVVLSAKPGTSVSYDLRVRNAGTDPQQLKAVIKKFTTEGPDGHVVFHNPGPTDQFVNWIVLSKTNFTAPPGEWQTIKMTVNLPPTAAFGYYYVVQFQEANPSKTQATGASIQGAVAIFVLLNAERPGEKRQVEVKSLSVDHKSYEFLPVNFSVQVHNSGDVHTAPSGNIFIYRGNNKVDTISVNSVGGNVLPGSNRIYKAAWDNGFPVYVNKLDAAGNPISDGKGGYKKKLSWNFAHANRLRFGHYRAVLAMVYNDGQRDVVINGEVSFWVMPWRVVIGLIIIALFVGVGVWSTVQKVRRGVKRVGRRES